MQIIKTPILIDDILKTLNLLFRYTIYKYLYLYVYESLSVDRSTIYIEF